MNGNTHFDFIDNPALEEIRRIQNVFNNSTLADTMRQWQSIVDKVKVPTDGMVAMLDEYQKTVAPLTQTIQKMDSIYAPILEVTKHLEASYNSSMMAVLGESTLAMKSLAGIDMNAITKIVDSLPSYEYLLRTLIKDFSFEEAAQLYENGTVSDEDIAEEINDVLSERKFSPSETWGKIKKAKWFLAIRIIFYISMFLASPVIDKIKDNSLEKMGVFQFWQESGIYECLDELFGLNESNSIAEQEAKESVDINKLGNISKQKREDLASKINDIRKFIATAPQDENTSALLSYIGELEKEIKTIKYGLVFEEHREAIDEILESHTPVLAEEENLFVDNGGNMNFLIEGDNLASLKLLEKTHKKAVDIIFIDPPYNRGMNDFVYDDNYVEKTDSFKHSKYMSFMKKRLFIAKKLLKSNGVIFINIDDNEVSVLKMLCDEIFGEVNFVACFPWHNRTSVQNDTDMSINHEYILAYAKNRRQTNRRLKPSNLHMWYNLNDFVFQPMSTDESKYSNPDNDPRGSWKADPFDAPAIRENLTYEIENPNTGVAYLPPKGRHWRTERSKYEALLLDNRIVFGKTGKTKPQLKVFLNESKAKGEIANSWFDASVYDTSTIGKKELLALFPEIDAKDIFDTPKPTKLYIELLKLIASPKIDNPTVLDFFAGSGTTGDAVMKYNNIENKKARFILCTNNQNDICRKTTYQRCVRVIKNNNYSASLKYYKVKYVPINERMYYEYADELLLHIRELVELENGINFAGNKKIAIVLSDEEVDAFFTDVECLKHCKRLYKGHDVLLAGEQENIVKANNIELIVIPDYYYKELEG